MWCFISRGNSPMNTSVTSLFFSFANKQKTENAFDVHFGQGRQAYLYAEEEDWCWWNHKVCSSWWVFDIFRLWREAEAWASKKYPFPILTSAVPSWNEQKKTAPILAIISIFLFLVRQERKFMECLVTLMGKEQFIRKKSLFRWSTDVPISVVG